MKKVFIGRKIACDINYLYDLVYSRVVNDDIMEIVDDPSLADIIVFPATCAGTYGNINYIINYINSIVEQKKDGCKVIVSGCITRDLKDDFYNQKVRNWLTKIADAVIPENNQRQVINEIFDKNVIEIDDAKALGKYSEEYDLATIYISRGCNNNCSFCKVNYSNFPVVSTDLSSIYELIDECAKEKIENIRLKGTNLAQYGIDLYNEYSLYKILEYINKKNEIKNVSLLGLAFKDAIRSEIGELIRESEKINMIIGSIESGSNRLLKLMNKGVTIEEILSFLSLINEKYPKEFQTSLIAGFPTETIDDVKKTIEVIKITKPTFVHLNDYQDAPFSDSHKLNQLSEEEILERAKIYRKIFKHDGISYQYNAND